MNTKQLIAIWYTAIVSLWLIAAGDFIGNRWAMLIVVSITIGLLSTFTLQTKNEFDKKQFFRWVIPGIAIPIIITAALIINAQVSEEVLPDSEKTKVQIELKPKHYDDGEIFAAVYNGSSYRITRVVVEISAKSIPSPEEWLAAESKGTHANVLWSRQYKDDVYVTPLTTGTFHVKATDTKDAILSFKISEIRGVKYR